MMTIGQAISRVRLTLKAVKEDPFLTDRNIYSLIVKYGTTLLKREDNQYKLMKMSSLFTNLSFVELIEVDTIEAECVGIYSGCTIKRTKEKLPKIFNGSFGPIIRTVSSIDASIRLQRTEPATYVSMTKTTTFKYNKQKYFWFINDYLYVPDVEWEAIKVQAIFEGDTSGFNCSPEDQCKIRQDQPLPFPEYLFSEIEQFTLKDLSITMQIPTNGSDDQQNVLR